MDENRSAAGGEAKPGDEADPDTAGTGEALCPICSGSGKVNGETCQNCRGTGKIIQGIGGA